MKRIGTHLQLPTRGRWRGDKNGGVLPLQRCMYLRLIVLCLLYYYVDQIEVAHDTILYLKVCYYCDTYIHT